MPQGYRPPKLGARRKPGARNVRNLSHIATHQAARNAMSDFEFSTPTHTAPERARLEGTKWRRLSLAKGRFDRRELTNRGRIAAKDALDRARITSPADREMVYDALPRFLADLRTGETAPTSTPLPAITKQVGLRKAGDFMVYFLENMRQLTRAEPRNKSEILHDAAMRRKKRVTGK